MFQTRPQTQTTRRTDGTASKASTSLSTKSLMGELNTVSFLILPTSCGFQIVFDFQPEQKFSGELLEVTLTQLWRLRKSCFTSMLQSRLHHRARRRKLCSTFFSFDLFLISYINVFFKSLNVFQCKLKASIDRKVFFHPFLLALLKHGTMWIVLFTCSLLGILMWL